MSKRKEKDIYEALRLEDRVVIMKDIQALKEIWGENFAPTGLNISTTSFNENIAEIPKFVGKAKIVSWG